jgi:hypothetical protein
VKGAAWLAGLTLLVLTTVWTVSPVMHPRKQMQGRTASPDIDGYAPGHRAVWASETPLESLLGPTDRLVEVVSRNQATFADVACPCADPAALALRLRLGGPLVPRAHRDRSGISARGQR